MIKSKNINDIKLSGVKSNTGFRSSAYGVYLNLLERFDSKELLLLESLGPGSVDTRVSLIGINPVLKIDVNDRIVSITGSHELLKKIQLIYEGEELVEFSGEVLRYQLTSRKAAWGFLRMLDNQFKTVEGGVLAFVAFAYNTIYFIEDIPGYSQGEIPDIHLTCYSTYIEFEEDLVRLHEYEFIGSRRIDFSDISTCLSLPDIAADTFF
jgi:anthranilate synthase component 1